MPRAIARWFPAKGGLVPTPGDILISRIINAKNTIPGLGGGFNGTAIGAGGTTSLGAGPSIGVRTAYRIMVAGDTGIGPYTADLTLDTLGMIGVYRGQHATPIDPTLGGGVGSILSGGQPIVRYHANTLTNTCWAVLFGERNQNLANMNANPGATVHRGFGTGASTLSMVLKDTNAEVTNWAQTDVVYAGANTAYGEITIGLVPASAGSLQFIGVAVTVGSNTLGIPAGTPGAASPDTRRYRRIIVL